MVTGISSPFYPQVKVQTTMTRRSVFAVYRPAVDRSLVREDTQDINQVKVQTTMTKRAVSVCQPLLDRNVVREDKRYRNQVKVQVKVQTTMTKRPVFVDRNVVTEDRRDRNHLNVIIVVRNLRVEYFLNVTSEHILISVPTVMTSLQVGILSTSI